MVRNRDAGVYRRDLLMRFHDFPHRLTATLALALAAGCAGPSAVSGGGGGGASTSGGGSGETSAAIAAAPPAPVGPAGASGANLAGSRCHGNTCTCRNRHAPAAETPPPDEGHKRFEIRLAAQEGTAVFDSPTLGQLTSTGDEVCYYVDVAPGTTHDVTFIAREAKGEGGVGPVLGITEYGPKGPWWYDILEVHCAGPGGKCNRDAADEWGADIKHRKRGRIDPCGSTVITHLNWDTSGGTGSRELGLFKDFLVKFTMEIKKFPTQFKPGSTECVPK
jgi:hypothetical protein